MSAVVTVTATIQSGIVVRWRRTTSDNERACLSASREGVMVHGDQWLTGPQALPSQWLADAHKAHGDLLNGRDVSHMATHKRRGLTGPLEALAAP